MRGILNISRAGSSCIRFVRATELELEDEQSLKSAINEGISIVCIDAENCGGERGDIFRSLGACLPASSSPYALMPRTELLDDLIASSELVPGLVIFIANADFSAISLRNELFDLIELFLIQFHHWFKKDKPCYICFEVEKNSMLQMLLTKCGVAVR